MIDFYYKLNIALLTFLISLNFLNAELLENYSLTPVEENEEGWTEYYNDFFLIKFPTAPIVTHTKEAIHYTATDSASFPLTIYSLTYFNPINGIEMEKFTDDLLLSSSNQRVILWHEIKETKDAVIVNLISHEKNTYMMRKEQVIITSKEIYALSTLFFTIGIENHEYFIEEFILFNN